MLETFNEALIMVGISCMGLLWAAALVGMMQVGWQTLMSPIKELRGKEKDAT
tara:strand:+ start:92 stop:247 length:156 start_codon:yes stop_codon:yes gene_type:complete